MRDEFDPPSGTSAGKDSASKNAKHPLFDGNRVACGSRFAFRKTLLDEEPDYENGNQTRNPIFAEIRGRRGFALSAEKPHKENTGVLYPKNQKWIAEKPGRPTHEGEVTILCPECSRSFRKRIVAWSKENQFGWFQTLAFNEAHKRQTAAPPAGPEKPGGVQ